MSPTMCDVASTSPCAAPGFAAARTGALPDPVGAQQQRCAWITYADNPIHFDGALVMYASMVDAGTRYPFIVMVPEASTLQIPPALAGGAGPGISLHRVGSLDRGGEQYLYTRYNATLNKLWLWKLTQFDKICWVDADMICVKNIDDVFDYDLDATGAHIAMAPGCRCNVFKNPKLPTAPEVCPFLHPGAETYYGNTGLFVTKPSDEMFDRLVAEDYNYPFPDQDGFNVIFGAKGILRLPSRYNYMNQLPLVHPETMKGYHYGIYHYCYGKPWDSGNANPLGFEPHLYERWLELRKRIHGGNPSMIDAPMAAPAAAPAKLPKEAAAGTAGRGCGSDAAAAPDMGRPKVAVPLAR